MTVGKMFGTTSVGRRVYVRRGPVDSHKTNKDLWVVTVAKKTVGPHRSEKKTSSCFAEKTC